MATIEWKYVSPLAEGTEVEALEQKYGYELPEDLKECIINHNAGVPSLCVFDVGKNKGLVFGGLLSFNESDLDNVYDFIDAFEPDDGNGLKMFPFGLDPAGNLLCEQNGKIVFYNHETDETTVVSDSFTEFLGKLYI